MTLASREELVLSPTCPIRQGGKNDVAFSKYRRSQCEDLQSAISIRLALR